MGIIDDRRGSGYRGSTPSPNPTPAPRTRTVAPASAPWYLGGTATSPFTRQSSDDYYLDYARRAAQNGQTAGMINYAGIAARQVQNELANLPSDTPPPGGRPPGGGPSGGGGRGGGMSAAPDPAKFFSQYAAAVANLAKGLTPGADTLTPRVNQAVDADAAAAQEALGKVGPVSGNPYADLKFQPINFDPNVARMLQAQGMGTGAADAAQMAGQQVLDQNAAMWGNYGTARSADQQASNQAWNADMEQNKAGIMSQIEMQRSALLARAAEIQRQKEEEFKMKRLELMFQLLGQGFGAGADVSGVDLGGLV